jgi:hypothetical protein
MFGARHLRDILYEYSTNPDPKRLAALGEVMGGVVTILRQITQHEEMK